MSVPVLIKSSSIFSCGGGHSERIVSSVMLDVLLELEWVVVAVLL